MLKVYLNQKNKESKPIFKGYFGKYKFGRVFKKHGQEWIPTFSYGTLFYSNWYAKIADRLNSNSKNSSERDTGWSKEGFIWGRTEIVIPKLLINKKKK